MKSFKTYLTEVKTRKAMRIAASKNRLTPEKQTALQSAKKRLIARAMTADIDDQPIKAQDIARNIDKIHDLQTPRPSLGYMKYGEAIPGVARDIQALRDIPDIADRIRMDGFLSSEKPPVNPVVKQRAIDAVSTLRRVSNMGPTGLNNDYMAWQLKNVHQHIMRSRLAGAAERMGFNASDVPEFKLQKPLGGKIEKKNKIIDKNKFKFGGNKDNPNDPLHESHTMSRLRKISNKKLKELQGEYKTKYASAKKQGKEKHATEHAKELKMINKLLGER